ncbi:hypothetical protein AB3662_20385 [Sorangium cellulosum]|uniref:hypothetical protein n=1 Tax=Sorangium cellulosum TaxID=56 RepID=UPI003D9A308C
MREAPPAGASAVSDTVIDGVPTIAVGDDPQASPAPEATSRSAGGSGSGGEQPGEHPPQPLVHAEDAGGAASAVAASAPETGVGNRGEYPPPAGKTRVGVGEPDAVADARTAGPDAVAGGRVAELDAVVGATAAEPQAAPAPAPSPPPAEGPRSTRATRSRAGQPAAGSADTASASGVRTEDHDPIELPVSGPNKTALRLGIAIVGAAFLFFVGRAILAPDRDDAGAHPTPASPAAETPPAVEAPPAPPAATPAATSQATAVSSPAAAGDGAATTPAPSASAPASPPAPAATPASSAAAPSRAGATPAAPTPAPKATTSAKKPAPEAPTQRGTSSTGGTKSGGIIRDAPF